MSLPAIARNTLGIIGLPFTLWNLSMNKKNKVSPPGQIFKTSLSEVHAIVSGDGPVTVILEAGFSSTSIDWCYIQPEISKVARVISYDRGSYGWSRTKRKTMTSLDSVEEIREILSHLKIKPPYILVGHSFGALSMRLFASMYPDEVGGLILEDAAHENQYVFSQENIKRIKKFKTLVTFGYITSLVGIPRMLKQKIGRKFLAKEYDDSLNYIGYTPGAYKSAYQEYVDSITSASQLLTSRPLRQDLPVIVISAKKQPESWKKNQLLLTDLTNNTEQIEADTGHSVHLENPKIVIDSILKLIRIINHSNNVGINKSS
ncbi:alpha/beta fold hydrolase [Mesobacillus jeotgali]|uniref:alpha/beta fold hydrolase n=1 Tax=Mesobacillus jeotgali TaxID=129985 RepID=UPI00177E67DC|nr:alpha/beta hydrolase [Mesobacillus jeotgali]UYZ24092.1 alpha/beta hydrolase [Mesobacillus jeotgali]